MLLAFYLRPEIKDHVNGMLMIYLTIYYLLQPYNAGTEMKSGTYRMILWMTYFVCYGMMKLKMPTPVFGAMMIGFSALYCMAACILIYKFAPKTFRLRM